MDSPPWPQQLNSLKQNIFFLKSFHQIKSIDHLCNKKRKKKDKILISYWLHKWIKFQIQTHSLHLELLWCTSHKVIDSHQLVKHLDILSKMKICFKYLLFFVPITQIYLVWHFLSEQNFVMMKLNVLHLLKVTKWLLLACP